MILDYATRYSEAILLRNMKSYTIAWELLMLYTCLGIPKEILTDQGTPFVSKIMKDLCCLMKVNQITTSVYHPQTDGLLEHFNQTLKQMIKRAVSEEKRDWDLLLPYLLPYLLPFKRYPTPLLGLVLSNSSMGGNLEVFWIWKGGNSSLVKNPM